MPLGVLPRVLSACLLGFLGLLSFVSGGPAVAQGTGAAVEATTIATATPAGVAYDAAGNLYVALRDDHKILKVDTTGLVV